jgi:hypothetical protein
MVAPRSVDRLYHRIVSQLFVELESGFNKLADLIDRISIRLEFFTEEANRIMCHLTGAPNRSSVCSALCT